MKPVRFITLLVTLAAFVAVMVSAQETTKQPATTKPAVTGKSTTTAKTTSTAPKEADTKTPEEAKINWVTFDVGMQRAKAENKHVVVDFTTSWCGWCKKMEAETFSDPDVIKLVNDNFVPVRVIGDSERKLEIDGYKITEEDLTTKTFGVRGFPCFAFLTAEGQNLGTIPGYRPKDNFVSLLNYVKDKKYVEEMKKQQGQSGQKDQSGQSDQNN